MGERGSSGEIPIARLLDRRLMLFDVRADDRQDCIRRLASCAERAGCVSAGYADDVIDRERRYPTGLPTRPLGVAVPHAISQDHVIHPAIVVARLARPVMFKEMGEGVRDVAVELVFLLIAKGGKHHLKVLQRLIGMLSDAESLRGLQRIDSADDMMRELLGHLS